MPIRDPFTRMWMFARRHPDVDLAFVYETIARSGVIEPRSVDRSRKSQGDRTQTGKPSVLSKWLADGDTDSLGITVTTPTGIDCHVDLTGFTGVGLLDRGPIITALCVHQTCVIDEMREWFTPLLEQLRCCQAAVDCKTGLMIEPHFPTKGGPLDYYVCRVDPSVYDELVVGYESELVWLGPTLRSRIASTATEQERLGINDWFSPSPDLLGETRPTVDRAQPYLSYIRRGEVVSWQDVS